ncbi:hypothetical protein B0T17DRAFT_589831 [Bombardia bombarda]|uniref:Uncharacterized protein n=1 Tax=Bombardia bombarda TaxID=252184 RepID=A0AA39XBL5_9PEZI|nr:hypothetical protein B0T17DRAFT_589831 [Bombardia bombarda]
MSVPKNILVVVGCGGMGLACARRLSSGRKIFLADASDKNLNSGVQSLLDDGHEVEGHIVDVSVFDSVQKFASAAANAGHIDAIIHTAGLSPVMANPEGILKVDLLGTANVIDAFFDVVNAGSSLTCIASIARFGVTPSPALAQHLGTAPRDQLLHNEELLQIASANSGVAYSLSKCANVLRVQAATAAWSAKGARINTVSPGVILTAMVRQELESPNRQLVLGAINSTPMARAGTANEIAGAVAFLAGPDASFITGSDVVVDGGAMASNHGMMGGNVAAMGHKDGES